MITIKFRSGELKRFKAGTTELRDGNLILYTTPRSRLWWCPTFPVEKIEWVRLSNGSIIIEDPDRRMWDCKEAAPPERSKQADRETTNCPDCEQPTVSDIRS